MTEKRFELNNVVKVGTVSFWDNENQKIVNATATLNLLNVLNDEVIAQGIVIEGYQNRNQQLFDENEQLKLDNKELRYANNIYCKSIDKIKKENGKLKSENRMLKTIIGKNEQFIGSITHKGKWR